AIVPASEDGGRVGSSPASGVADARGRIPGSGDDLIEGLLNPDGIVLVEVDDRAQRLAVVKVVLNVSAPGEGADADLNPRVTGNHLRLRQPEVLHDAKTLGVRAEVGMPKAGAGVLVGIRKRKFVADGIFFQEAEGV